MDLVLPKDQRLLTWRRGWHLVKCFRTGFLKSCIEQVHHRHVLPQVVTIQGMCSLFLIGNLYLSGILRGS